jgi:hypothetical protein
MIERVIHSPVEEEEPSIVAKKDGLLKGHPVNNGAGFAWRQPRLHEASNQGEPNHVHKSDQAHGPSKAKTREKTPYKDGVGQTTYRVARRYDTQSDGPARAEVGQDEADRRREQNTTSKPRQDALCEKQLPILGGNTRKKYSDELKHGANKQCRGKETGIQQTAREGARGKCKPGLDRANPRDRGWAFRQLGDIIRLEPAKRVHPSPADDHYDPAHRDLSPCLGSAIGGLASWGRTGGGWFLLISGLDVANCHGENQSGESSFLAEILVARPASLAMAIFLPLPLIREVFSISVLYAACPMVEILGSTDRFVTKSSA